MRRFLIEALPSRAQLVTFLPLHDLERGRYRVALVRAVGSDVLGLFRPRKKIAPLGSQPGEASGALTQQGGFEPVIVGPRVVRLGQRHAREAMGVGGSGGSTASLAGRSDEFGGTRPYVAGDDLRFVHWKSTARRGEMVVREWERATLHHSLVLWDGAAFPAPATPASARATSTSAASPSAGASPGAPAAGAKLMREAEAGVAWRRGVEWSLEVALSLANALAESGEPCSLWRLDASPARAEVSGASSVARGAELLADAQASRTSPLQEALRTVAAQGAARELEGRAFVVALFPSPSLLATARRLRGATVVLIDISRLDERDHRARQAAWRGWRQALDEGEAQLREAGLRVLRLPFSAPGAEARGAQNVEQSWEAEQAGQDVDLWTRDALRALLGERAAVARASF